jgi:hypothetical protein
MVDAGDPLFVLETASATTDLNLFALVSAAGCHVRNPEWLPELA